MSRTLKEMLNSVLSRSAFLQRDVFASSTDPDNIQMVEFANRTAAELRDLTIWPVLRKTTLITMVTDQLIYDLPADFGYLVPESMWKYLGSRQVDVPTNDRLWGWFKAGNPGRGVTYYGKIIQGKLEFQQVNGGDQVTFDYISDFPVLDTGGTPKERFTADTDTFVLDEETLILGTSAAWKAEKKIGSAMVDKEDYRRSRLEAIVKDVGAKTIRQPNPGHYRGSSPLSSDYVWP